MKWIVEQDQFCIYINEMNYWAGSVLQHTQNCWVHILFALQPNISQLANDDRSNVLQNHCQLVLESLHDSTHSFFMIYTQHKKM